MTSVLPADLIVNFQNVEHTIKHLKTDFAGNVWMGPNTKRLGAYRTQFAKCLFTLHMATTFMHRYHHHKLPSVFEDLLVLVN